MNTQIWHHIFYAHENSAPIHDRPFGALLVSRDACGEASSAAQAPAVALCMQPVQAKKHEAAT